MKKVNLYNLVGKGDSYEFDNPREITVGREEDNMVVVKDRWVSRKHCLIERVDKNYAISDCKSKHGTFVNGTRIESCLLLSGDIIGLGPISKYRFEVENS